MESASAVAPTPLDVAPAAGESRFPVRFVGSGSEYFRIWIVNLLLTIVTLGLYSPWAKVRRLKYLYRNTQVADASFDYHGEPIAILKGRLIAGALLLAYNFSFQFSFTAGLVVLVVLLTIAPWLLRQALRFRLRNSSYRGIRFRFDGSLAEACWIVLPVVALTAPFFMAGAFAKSEGDEPPVWFTVVFLSASFVYLTIVPYLHYRLKRYQHAHSHLGSASGRFLAKIRSFYAVYAITGALMFVVGAAAAALAFAVGWGSDAGGDFGIGLGFLVGLLAFYALLIVAIAAFVAWIQNRVWNATELGDVRFSSRARARDLARIHIINALLIVITIGLYTPFAVVRSLKYRLEAVTANSASGMEGFYTVGAVSAVDATGEGAADLFDFDIGL